MRKLLTPFLALVALLLATVPCVTAQTTAPTTAYTGPRYPGGPDSLRALVYRSTRQLASSLAGRSVIQFELKDGRQPNNFKVVGPERANKSDLAQATQAAMQYLQAQMLAWEPAPPRSEDKPGRNPKIMLALNFAAIARAQPYAYADQDPVFPYLEALRAQGNTPNFKNNPEGEAVFAKLAASNSSLASYLQRQVRYPPEALRNQQQGQVKVYFEVSESGAIENPEVVGSAGGALDSEVLRAAKSLRPAIKPALLNGEPVRIFYVLPLNFKIQ